MIDMNVLRGRYSKYVNESKFESNINTINAALLAIKEGEDLRNKLKGKRVLDTIIPVRDTLSEQY